MSTIGHPLSDLSNLLSPYTFALVTSTSSSSPELTNAVSLGATKISSFAPSNRPPGLPSREQCMSWYTSIAGWDPAPESKWGDAFGVFRNSVIMQGIAARYALRQASSAKAKEHAVKMGPFGEFAWSLAVEAEKEGKARTANPAKAKI